MIFYIHNIGLNAHDLIAGQTWAGLSLGWKRKPLGRKAGAVEKSQWHCVKRLVNISPQKLTEWKDLIWLHRC